MAKTDTGKPAAITYFGARIPADLHKRAKRHAVEAGLNLKEVMELALIAWLDKHEEEGAREGREHGDP